MRRVNINIYMLNLKNMILLHKTALTKKKNTATKTFFLQIIYKFLLSIGKN